MSEPIKSKTRKSELEAVQQTVRFFETLLRASSDGIVITDAMQNIILVNEAFCSFFGRHRREVIETNLSVWLEQLDPGAPQQWVELDRHIHLKGECRGTEFKKKTTDGLRYLSVNASLLEQVADEEKGVIISIWRDITERKKSEQELQKAYKKIQERTRELTRSNRDLEQFAYVVSHDLQEPLRMIVSYLQLLERRYKEKLDQDADDFIDFAVDGATRMQKMIDSLLAYSRVATYGKPFKTTDTSKLLEQTMANLSIAIEDSSAEITHDPLPKITCDEIQLLRLFQNLVGNAIKFRGTAPLKIHVGAERKDNEWVFSVRDNGIGIDPSHTERIFQIFQRLHGRAEYPGTGIGLAICKRIVERHNGRIWVDSKPGQGATFYFTIPIIDEGV